MNNDKKSQKILNSVEKHKNIDFNIVCAFFYLESQLLPDFAGVF